MSEIGRNNVVKDINLIIWSSKLSNIYRFTHQRFWEKETLEHEYAMRIEGVDNKENKVPRTESVAEHSWHMSQIAIIIAPRFKELNIEKCLLHATLHDILEIITDDKNPLGRNGQGTKTHAFSFEKKREKIKLEKEALETYLGKVNEYSFPIQREILEDAITLHSPESRFVKAVDRIHPLIYILRKKRGNLNDEHIQFTIKYSGTCIDFFPEIEPYYNELVKRLLYDVSLYRNITFEEIERQFSIEQLSLFKKP